MRWWWWLTFWMLRSVQASAKPKLDFEEVGSGPKDRSFPQSDMNGSSGGNREEALEVMQPCGSTHDPRALHATVAATSQWLEPARSGL